MPTNYPASLDSFTNPTAADPPNSPSHAGQHANINDAMEAVQTVLGTNPQGSAASVAARIAAIEGAGGVTMVPLAASGDGVVSTTPETVATTAAFTTTSTKDIGFNLSSIWTSLLATGTLTVTAELVNDEAAVVDSESVALAFTSGQRDAVPMAGVFADAPADTYTVRITGGSSSGSFQFGGLPGFILH